MLPAIAAQGPFTAVQLAPHDDAARKAILLHRAERAGIPLDPAAADHLLRHESRDLRALLARMQRPTAADAPFVDAVEQAAGQKQNAGFGALFKDGLARDTLDDERPAFVVVDGQYVSARWPGDAHTFARRFEALLR